MYVGSMALDNGVAGISIDFDSIMVSCSRRDLRGSSKPMDSATNFDHGPAAFITFSHEINPSSKITPVILCLFSGQGSARSFVRYFTTHINKFINK